MINPMKIATMMNMIVMMGVGQAGHAPH